MTILQLLPFLPMCFGLAHPSLLKRQTESILRVSLDELAALRDSIGGRLYPGIPASVPCFSSYDNGHSVFQTTPVADTCNTIRANWNNGSFISQSFGGYMTPDFGTCITKDQGCVMSNNLTTGIADVSASCHQGSVPSYYIDVRDIGDIQAGFDFAKTHRVPLVVKNTGHDYSGRSSGRNSLALWLHNYKPPLRLYDEFYPQGCDQPAGPAIAASAGHQFADLQLFAHENGYTIISGVSGSVGASGGWILGGGHSALSPKLGLGVDNVLQLTAVLPNGTIVTANRCQNKDVFFAFRGGGGNSFGVLVETVYVAHKEFPVQSVKLSFNFENKNDTVAMLTKNAEQWNKDGWGVYFDVLNGTLNMDGIVPYLNQEEAQRSLKPLTDFAFSQQNIQVDFLSHPDYWTFSQSPQGQFRGSVAIGDSFVVSSRLMQRDLFQNASSRQTLTDAVASQGFLITTVGPAFFKLPETDQPGGPGEASIQPAWRDSFWFLMLRAQWDSGNAVDTRLPNVVANIQKNDKAIQALRDLTPNGGTYFNEAHPYEPNEGQSFWGQSNYERLLKIKKDFDPENILTCWQCVGYDRNDPRFGCYPQL